MRRAIEKPLQPSAIRRGRLCFSICSNRYIRLLAFAVLLLFAPVCAFGQSPSPSPAPTLQPQPTPSWEAGLPSAQMSELLIHVRELVPYIRRQIERPLMEKFKTLGLILSGLVMLFSFIRVMRENDGASTDMVYWVARAPVFLFIFGFASQIIRTMYTVRRSLSAFAEWLCHGRFAAARPFYGGRGYRQEISRKNYLSVCLGHYRFHSHFSGRPRRHHLHLLYGRCLWTDAVQRPGNLHNR